MEKYDPAIIEPKWRKKWEEEQVYKTPEIKKDDNKAYILDMYPYPSGSGLHVGHPRGYVGTDVVTRFTRMQGKKVLHPMGFDSFGLPAENYAIKTGVHPQITTDNAIAMFKSQIENIGLSYDWNRELSVHVPEYYKWTQWLFLQFYKKGLAYKKTAPVNWCPKDNTVLANEQVIDGRCERCDTEVIQKDMDQWFFKITAYADELVDDLAKIDWPESTKLGQINWIGRSEGARIKFEVRANGEKVTDLEVFSTAHDTIFGATFMVVAPEHKILKEHFTKITNQDQVKKYIEEAKSKTELERQQQKEKTGVKIEGIVAINPMNREEIPIFVADYVLAGYGTGAIMAVPGHDERDGEFAKKYGMPIPFVADVKEFTSYSETIKKDPTKFKLINSGEYDGLDYKTGREKMMQDMEVKGIAAREVNYRLRDWLLSRQRYWGAPIPIVYDPEGNAHPVDEADLPVLLPTDVDFKPTGESPLVYSESFHKSAEEKYGKGWKRETDTMDTFVDSSWYFFRFTDPHNEQEFASKEQMNKWMPVDLYVGGAEHTVLHLMYSRFFTKALRDMGYLNFDEPFMKLRHQGMILAEDSRKMSKRWGNTLDPNDEIAKYGADTFRMYEMFIGPFEATMPWNTKTEVGVFRFLTKVWGTAEKVSDDVDAETLSRQNVQVSKLIHKVENDVTNMAFNTAIAKMMEFINFLGKEEKVSKEVWSKFVLVIAPFGPYIAEELWSQLGNKFSVHQQTWPTYDKNDLIEDTIELAVQINGKVRGTLSVSKEISEEDVMNMIKSDEQLAKYLTGEIRKVIYVPAKIVNIVI